MNFDERISKFKKGLEPLTTAENAESIAALFQELDGMKQSYDEAVQDGQKAKDALVRIVSTTPVANPTPEKADPVHDEVPPSLDEAITASLASIVNNRPKP